MEKIFVMNLGTTSFKFKFYAFEGDCVQVLATGELESVGAEKSYYENGQLMSEASYDKDYNLVSYKEYNEDGTEK